MLLVLGMDSKAIILIILFFLKQSILYSQNTLFTMSIDVKSSFGTKGEMILTQNELPYIYLNKLSTAGNICFSGLNYGVSMYLNKPTYSFGIFFSTLSTVNGYSFYSIKNQYNNDQYSYSLLTKTKRNSFGISFKGKFKLGIKYEIGIGVSKSLLKNTQKNYRYNSLITYSDSTDYSVNNKIGSSFFGKLIFPIKIKQSELFNFFLSYEQGFIIIDKAYYNITNLKNEQLNLISNSRGSQFTIGFSKEFNFYKNEKKN